MPATPDDPEIVERLARAGWSPGDPLPRMTRLAAYGLIRREGRLLLCRVAPGNIGGGLWVLPGGGLEFGESPEAAVVREVEEETGLLAKVEGAPTIHSDTGTWPFSAGPVTYHTVRFVYPMHVVDGTERREVDGSTDEYGWFAPEELAGLRLGDLAERVLATGPSGSDRGDQRDSRAEASSA